MDLNEYIEQKHDEHLSDLYEFLRIPSVSAQSQHKPDIERAAQWVAERLRRAGLDRGRNRADEDASAGVRRIAACSGQANGAFLRPLRRAAARAAGTVDFARV